MAIALALGLRKGETLGLKWSGIDPDKGTLKTPKQLQRYAWRHGCDDPHACGEKLHKRKPCPPNCTVHKQKGPPPCPQNCVRHARSCPRRVGGGLVEVPVKSRAGKRTVGIPRPLVEWLRRHKQVQEVERRAAGDLWQEGDWVFTQLNGKPIDPRQDHEEWKNLLADAGVRDAKLHNARRTAATVLGVVLRVPPRTVMEVMGWSQISMTTRYEHVPIELLTSIAQEVGGVLWKEESQADGGDTEPDADSA